MTSGIGEITNRHLWNSDFSNNRANWKGRIVVIWSGLGEYAWAKRIENACRNLGWHCVSSIDPVELTEYDKLVQEKPTTPADIQRLIKEHDPDCVINLKWDRIYTNEVPNYLAVTGVFEHLLNPTSNQQTDLLSFDGILRIKDNAALRTYYETHGKPYHSMVWYPSATATTYQAVCPKTLFCCGFQWDDKRNGTEYRKMFALLDRQGCLDIYGPAAKWDCAPHSVRGMTFDEEALQAAMRKSGIVLVLHNQQNLDLGTPAARVFEAAAAGCIIISDRHPFIMQEFGDCILYVDHTQPGEVLYQQIDRHRQWILSHPEEAELMAKKAHSIFSEKFTLEKQLQAFKEFHLKITEAK